MIGNAKEDDTQDVFFIHVPMNKEQLEAKKREEEWNQRMREPPKNAVHPHGKRVYPFHRFFRCFAKRTRLSDNRFYNIFCNNFVYTTDGRMFVGNYIPGDDALEDLDPLMMVPAEYIFCCGCCCPSWLED
jgi:hypothetical protein